MNIADYQKAAPALYQSEYTRLCDECNGSGYAEPPTGCLPMNGA